MDGLDRQTQTVQKFSPPKSKRRFRRCVESEAKKDPVGTARFEAPAFRFAAEPVAAGGTAFPNSVPARLETKSGKGFFLFQGRAARIVLAALSCRSKYQGRFAGRSTAPACNFKIFGNFVGASTVNPGRMSGVIKPAVLQVDLWISSSFTVQPLAVRFHKSARIVQSTRRRLGSLPLSQLTYCGLPKHRLTAQCQKRSRSIDTGFRG